MEVHRQLGTYLLREAYMECLAHEFSMREIIFRRDVPGSVTFKGRQVAGAYRFDFIVENLLVVDVQTFAEEDRTLAERHKHRLSSLLRLSGYEVGMLVNFHAEDIRRGVKRLIVSDVEPMLRWR